MLGTQIDGELRRWTVMRQSEPQRFTGWFYLPETPTKRIPGILTWQPDNGATLELIGGLSPEPEYQQTPGGGLRATQIVGDVRHGTIYGVSESGQALTLWDAQRGKYTAGLVSGVRDEFWHSSWICIGAHIADPEEAVFNRAVVAIDELYYLTDDGRFCAPQWTNINGVEHPGERQPDGTLLMPYALPIVGGYRAEYAVGETTDARYSVATNATRPWISDATEAMPDLKLQMMTNNLRRGPVITLHVGAHIAIRLPDGKPGSGGGFAERLAPIQDLVQIATFDVCGVAQIVLYTDDDSEVSLLMHVGTIARPDDMHKPASVIFTLIDVPLGVYLEIQQRLTDGKQANYAWNVAVGLCGYSPRMVEEYVSQALAAAEGFHRWCLKGGSDVVLNSRLKALHDSLAPEVQSLLKLNVEHWAGWAVWARNHVTHGGTKRWRPIRDNYEMHAIAESVHLITYLSVLRELGVPLENVLDALRNHPRLLVRVQCCSEVNDLPAEPPAGDTA